MRFSRKLWRNLFRHLDPAVVLCYGQPVFLYFEEVLRAQGFTLLGTATEAPTGWGSTTYRIHPLACGPRRLMLVGFPHFSRYTVCTSAKCFAQMEEPIRIIADGLAAFPEWLRG